jgi:hypothetical protein
MGANTPAKGHGPVGGYIPVPVRTSLSSSNHLPIPGAWSAIRAPRSRRNRAGSRAYLQRTGVGSERPRTSPAPPPQLRRNPSTGAVAQAVAAETEIRRSGGFGEREKMERVIGFHATA